MGFDGFVDKDVLRGGGKGLSITVRGGFGDHSFCGRGHGKIVEVCVG